MATGGTWSKGLQRIAWLTVAAVGAVALTQVFGITNRRFIAVAQSLTPYLGLLMTPIALGALWSRRLRLAAVSTATGIGILLLAAPLAFPDGQPDPIAGASGLRVASANLFFGNDQVDRFAEHLRTIAPDVIVFSEYTAAHEELLLDHPLADDYPYRTDRSEVSAGGIAVWSRRPVVVGVAPDTFRNSIDLRVDGPDGEIRIVAMHAPTPLDNLSQWRRDLSLAARIGRDATGPTMVVGDLNASYWHPYFRRLLDAGLVDAHISLGEGFSTSWPTDRAFPPFVRLDHALTVGGLVSTEVTNFDIPGSDHTGFVVTVAPTARAAP